VTNKVDVVVDLQFGSTGKGLIAGYLAKTNNYDTVINANMPNAGHTFVDRDGRKWMHKVLPNGIVSPGLEKVMIGPGSVFSLDRLMLELTNSADILAAGIPIIIHEDAMVLHDEHIQAENKLLSRISSTMQGSAAAAIDKILRDSYNDQRAKKKINFSWKKMAKDEGFDVVLASNDVWLDMLHDSKSTLLEGAQGYSLGINAGFWPYCTSRDCTPARFMADCGVPLGMLNKVIGTARLHPIRVGNTPDGYSGDCYSDQHEISWEDLGVGPEMTTVTGRKRRVFTFSDEQMRSAIMACQPNEVFLNFCNYDPDIVELTIGKINGLLQLHVNNGGSVRYTGWGPKETDVRERHFLNPCDYNEKQIDEGWVQ